MRAGGAPLRVDRACHVAGGAGQLRDALPVQQLDRRAAPLPLLRARAQRRDGGRVRRRADPAGLMRLAGDLVAGDELEDEVGGGASELPHPSAHLRAKLSLQLVRIVLESRNDLAAVVAGAAPTGLRSVQYHHVRAPLGQVEGRRQACVAGSDHRDVGAAVSLEGPRPWQGLGSSPERSRRVGRRRRVDHLSDDATRDDALLSRAARHPIHPSG